MKMAYMLCFLTSLWAPGSMAQTNDQYKMTDAQKVAQNFQLSLQGRISELNENQDQFNHAISFSKNPIVRWPDILTIKMPTATRDQVRAYKWKEQKGFVLYRFDYLRNTVLGGLGEI